MNENLKHYGRKFTVIQRQTLDCISLYSKQAGRPVSNSTVSNHHQEWVKMTHILTKFSLCENHAGHVIKQIALMIQSKREMKIRVF